jgi:hypothetical protein
MFGGEVGGLTVSDADEAGVVVTFSCSGLGEEVFEEAARYSIRMFWPSASTGSVVMEVFPPVVLVKSQIRRR